MFRLLVINLICVFFIFADLYAAQRSFHGVVYDRLTQQALAGVLVVLSIDSSHYYALTDDQGAFSFSFEEADNFSLELSRLGYQSERISHVPWSENRGVQFEHALMPSVENLDNVTVQASIAKDRPVNHKAQVSARSFTLEETNRFAGSYGDPSRMAANYAGVLSARDNRNDIIIRGNTSSGLLWRIDGMEVPNPNHFGATGSTGGPVTIINTNLLSRSDFLTGAFPAEYSNATAGVFDLKMREGNPESGKHWAQLGWNGLEAGTEGPLPVSKSASYVMAYRYSFVGLLSRLGVDLQETADYQDFSAKVNMPTNKMGSFSLSGMGGSSHIALLESDKTLTDWFFPVHAEDVYNQYRMAVLGIHHHLDFSDRTRWKSVAYWTGSQVENRINRLASSEFEPVLWAHENTRQHKMTLSSSLRHKYSPNIDFSLGAYADQYQVTAADSQLIDTAFRLFTASVHEPLLLLRFFADMTYRYMPSLSVYLGVNGQYLDLTQEAVVEPRGSISWQLAPRHKLAYGIGWHSQMQPLMVYFVLNEQGAMTNNNLRFTRSFQQVLGYDWRMKDRLRLKAEMYYQKLSRIPVSMNQTAYSLSNFGAEFYIEREDSLVSLGNGVNYGLELTLEKFYTSGYFFLITVSLFESQYQALDQVWRNTAFNGQYATNFLAGYEWHAPGKGRSLHLGLNFTYAGGRPYVPYDIPGSMQERKVVYDWEHAYQVRRDDYTRISIRLGFKRVKERIHTETAFDLQYRTNYTSIYLDRLNWQTGEIVSTQTMGFYPMATWRIHF